MKEDKTKEQLIKTAVLGLLILLCAGATYYFHIVLRSEVVFSYLFYVPIVLAGFWWGRQGAWVAVLLGALLLATHFLSGVGAPLREDIIRSVMFVAVGLMVGILRERVQRSEKNLRETRDYLDSLIRYANAPVIVWDPALRITLFNNAFEHLTGYTADEVIGQELRTLFPETSRDESLNKIARTLSGEYWESVEIPILRQDGETQLALWNSANIYAEDGRTLLATIAQGQDITKRKQAEQKLRELNRAIEQSWEGIATADLDGKFVFVNPTWAEMHGYQTADLIGKPVAMLDSPADTKNLPTVWETIKKKGFWRGELLRVRKDGSFFPVIMTSSLVKDDAGRPVGIIGTCLDITERKRAEAALRESEEKYRVLFETAKDAIFLTDETGSLLDVNRTACESLGYSKEELLKLSNREIDADPRGYEAFLKVRNGLAEEATFEVNQRRKDGTLLPVEITGGFFTVGGQRISLAIARDITERRQAEERLRLLSSVVEQSSEGIAMSDLEGNLLFVNNTFAAMHGYTPEELAGKHLSIFHTPEQMPSVEAANQQIQETGEFSGEIWHVRRDGAVFPTLMHNSLLRDETGNPIGMIGALRDITERVQAEEEIRLERDKFQGLLAAIGDGVDVTTYDYRVVYSNLRNIIGKDELVEHLCYEVFLGRDSPCERCPMRRAIESGRIETEEILLPDGKIVEVRSSPLRLPTGEMAAIEIARDITERAQAREALKRRATQLATLGEVGRQITSLLELDSLLDRIVNLIHEAFNYRYVNVFLVDPTRGELALRAGAGYDLETAGALRLRVGEEGICGWVAASGESLLVGDVSQEPRYLDVLADTRSELAVPIQVKGQIIGVLDVQRAELEAFDEEDFFTLRMLANQVGVAIENTRLFEAEQQQRELAEALEEAAAAVSGTLDPNQVLDRILEQVERVVAGDAFNVMLIEGRIVRAVRWRGYERFGAEERIASFAIPVAEYITLVKMRQTREPVVIPDTSTDPDWVAAEGWEWERSYVGAPILVSGVTVGILNVDGTRPGQFGPADAHRLEAFADHAAAAIENARLFEQAQQEITERKRAEEDLQRTLEKLREALGGIVQAVALTVEMRDPYTAGHQRRVSNLARALANEMGLPQEQIDGIRMAGLIHDLGKVGVPTEILSRPGRLSDLQFGLIKAHSQIGYDVLKKVDFPWPVAQIVLQHHEKMDGSGYPQGLSGEEVLLEARILAVADVVEAMASRRPYRPPRGLDKALEEISQNRGILYDPEVVDVCLKLFTEKGFEFE